MTIREIVANRVKTWCDIHSKELSDIVENAVDCILEDYDMGEYLTNAVRENIESQVEEALTEATVKIAEYID